MPLYDHILGLLFTQCNAGCMWVLGLYKVWIYPFNSDLPGSKAD